MRMVFPVTKGRRNSYCEGHNAVGKTSALFILFDFFDLGSSYTVMITL